MATFDLKRQLKIHDRELLRQLLGREPSMVNLDWHAIPKNDIEPISSRWEDLADDQKRHYQVILQDVAQLAERRQKKGSQNDGLGELSKHQRPQGET